jgi:CheY-like chemotaxis protein
MLERNGKPAVILLAEDDPGDQEIVRRAFQNSKIRNELVIVSDGEEALDYLFHKGKYADADIASPDLILLDLNMPKIDGREVAQQIRSNAQLRYIPIVVLTTSKQEEDIVRSYNLGVNSYITKPVTIDQFIKVLQKLEEYWFQIVVLPPREV